MRLRDLRWQLNRAGSGVLLVRERQSAYIQGGLTSLRKRARTGALTLSTHRSRRESTL